MLRVTTRDAGALIDGREVAGLPPSLASAGTGAGARAVIRGVAGSLLEEQSRPTGFVLSGAEWTELEVLP